MKKNPILYLVPVPIHRERLDTIAPETKKVIRFLRVYIVERARTARRFIKELAPDIVIDDLLLIELDKHKQYEISKEIQEVFKSGADIGLMSESGTPCVADPGSGIVNFARSNKYTIRPLAGPSSLIMALMASGMNGQNFHFHGYLPVQSSDLTSRLRELSREIMDTGVSQIFIETPYRHNHLMKTLVKCISADLDLCVARNLTGDPELIKTQSVGDWKGELDKSEKVKYPTVYILGKVG